VHLGAVGREHPRWVQISDSDQIRGLMERSGFCQYSVAGRLEFGSAIRVQCGRASSISGVRCTIQIVCRAI